jgi:hypothetical protein
MTFESSLSIWAEPTQPMLDISASVQQPLWQACQSYSTANARYQAYLNQLCLAAVVPWLQTEVSERVQPWPNRATLPSFWEVVNGTPIMVGSMRLLCIPSEAIDLSEVRVPQEWVDCPSWIADYYLAVQVEPDQGWVRVWGYCTHQLLQQQGTFDPSDRTYSLDETQLIQDLSVFAVAQQVCPQEATRGSVELLPALSQLQAENLLQRLGNPEIFTPRLEVPFLLWGALVDHGGWRKRLYELRSGQSELWFIRHWLAQGISEMGQQLGWQRLEWNMAPLGARGEEVSAPAPMISRLLTIEQQVYELTIQHLSDREAPTWRFELSTATPGLLIPEGFALGLLTEDLQPFENNTDTATTTVDALWVEVVLEVGEGIVWEVSPSPEGYDREILYL